MGLINIIGNTLSSSFVKGTIVTGVLDFDGVNDYVQIGGVSTGPVVTGNRTLTFKLYIKSIPSSDEIVCHFNAGNVNDLLSIHLDSSGYMVVSRSGNTSSGGRRVDISGLLNKELLVIVTKASGSISSISINGTDNSISATTYTPYNGSVAYIGSGTASNYLGVAYIWDINLNSEHSYSGHPDGNLDSAWEDNIGSIDGTVNGSPTTTDII